jgi:phage terminase large subunit GpA-like protein
MQAVLRSRVEGFDIDNISREVLALTVGIDCQIDRVEATILGHGRDGTVYALAHQVLWG